jgi:hypothetical protein
MQPQHKDHTRVGHLLNGDDLPVGVGAVEANVGRLWLGVDSLEGSSF